MDNQVEDSSGTHATPGETNSQNSWKLSADDTFFFFRVRTTDRKSTKKLIF
jgi:hypothetical protein